MSQNPQLAAVRRQLVAFQERLDLKTNVKAKEKLLLLFQTEGWLADTADPSAADLIRLAMSRIKTDVKQYEVFIKMLQSITEVSDIVKMITGI